MTWPPNRSVLELPSITPEIVIDLGGVRLEGAAFTQLVTEVVVRWPITGPVEQQRNY